MLSPRFEELTALASQHPGLRLHLVDTAIDGRLDSSTVLADVGADLRQLSVFMCGPSPMLAAFERQFRAAGVPRRHILREYFDLR